MKFLWLFFPCVVLSWQVPRSVGHDKNWSGYNAYGMDIRPTHDPKKIVKVTKEFYMPHRYTKIFQFIEESPKEATHWRIENYK